MSLRFIAVLEESAGDSVHRYNYAIYRTLKKLHNV